jgi:hypothetical protein
LVLAIRLVYWPVFSLTIFRTIIHKATPRTFP